MRANLDQERELDCGDENEEGEQLSHARIIRRLTRVSKVIGLALALALAGCESAVEPSVLTGDARVTDVDVALLESFPVQARATIAGELGDGCTTLDAIETTRAGNEFRIRITTARPADAFCTQQLVLFEETVSLDVYGLDAGEYRVVANGVAATFRLEVDNR